MTHLPARDLPPLSQPEPQPRRIPDEPWEPLHPNPELIAHLLRLTPAGVAVLDGHLRVLAVSAAACQLLARTEEELLKTCYLDVFHPDEQPTMRARWTDPSLPDRYRNPSRVVDAHGQTKDVETIHFHVTLENRPLVGVVLLDVTESRRLLHRLSTLTQFTANLTVAGSLKATLEKLTEQLTSTTQATHCTVELSDAPQTLTHHHNEVTVPLRFAGRPLGALRVTYPEPVGAGELTFLTSLADLVALAVENARLVAQAQEKAVLEERQRLAWELHDSVSQALHGISLGVQTARKQLERDPAQAAAPLDYVLNLCEGAHHEMQALLLALRPDKLELAEALRTQIKALQTRHGLAVHAILEDSPLPHDLYRVASEALHNVVKHARAKNVTVTLTATTLTITDDGRGFDPSQEHPGHYGLRTMRERMDRLGGTLTLESGPQGTTLKATCPKLTPD